MFKAFTLLFLVAITTLVAAEEAYFKFQYRPYPDEFVIKLTDDAKIQEARRILSGEERDSIHVMGRIKKSLAPYNPNWDFHIDPDTIRFFPQAIEVCDASIRYTNEHLDEACGPFLPGCYWCPWSSELTGEVNRYQSASAALFFQKYYNSDKYIA